MKKLITLTFALLFSAGVAFGQSSSTTDQTGNNNQASITQDGYNDATITQTNNKGQGQKASIDQVYQTGVTSGKNTAAITQAGSNNKAIDLKQFGAGNLYTVTQKGMDNLIMSLPDQGVQPDGPSYNATIKMLQDGKNNIINDAAQVGNGNTFIVNQRGDNNKADMKGQINNGLVADGNYMEINQNGDDNNAGYAHGLYQEGQNNSLTLTQEGGALFGSTDVTLPAEASADGSSAVIQLGIGNVIRATQAAGSNVVESILQNGSDNMLTIHQDGDASTVEAVSQIGIGNTGTITQGAGVNTAELSQNGDNNTATIIQN
jgi:minor curlin subunit